MKIALVALPRPQQNIHRVAPPLSLGYLAALLEQQRHIVRIYDLALASAHMDTHTLAPVQVFRPHLIVLAADPGTENTGVATILEGIGVPIVRLGTALRDETPGKAVARVLRAVDGRIPLVDEHVIIFDAVRALNGNLDTLPFPARHLLPLEMYPLYTPDGNLQTPVQVAQHTVNNQVLPRQVAPLLAEIESVVREYGIRHFVFPKPFMSCNGTWLHDLLQQLIAAKLDICWEACVNFEELDPDVLHLFREAGCEVLCVAFSAGDVLESREARATLAQLVTQTRELGMSVRGEIALAPPFGALAALVDLSATFGLDAVSYTVVQQAGASRQSSAHDEKLLDEVMRMERSRRGRQHFVDRFGPQLGPMLWHVGRVGLLGPSWRRYAYGDDGAYVY